MVMKPIQGKMSKGIVRIWGRVNSQVTAKTSPRNKRSHGTSAVIGRHPNLHPNEKHLIEEILRLSISKFEQLLAQSFKGTTGLIQKVDLLKVYRGTLIFKSMGTQIPPNEIRDKGHHQGMNIAFIPPGPGNDIQQGINLVAVVIDFK
jgi:hypothetical protein